MTFENDLQPTPSRWSIIKDHLPILLLAGGVIAVFLGLHMAASGVAVLGVLHLVGALVAVAVQRFRRSSSPVDA